MLKNTLPLLLLFVLFTSASAQQSTPKGQAPAESIAQEALKKKAEILLSEIAQQARRLKNKENQILMKIAIADLLWQDHQAAARSLYKEAFDNLHQTSNGVDAEEESPEDDREGSLSRLGERLLQSLGRHDPVMARELLRSTRATHPSDAAKSDVTTPSDDQSSDTRLELTFVTEMAERDPKEAARIARESLSQGYPYQLIPLLFKLAAKEPKLAQELALEVINKLRKENLNSNSEAMALAVSFIEEAIEAAKEDKDIEPAQRPPALLDTETTHALIEFVTDSALKNMKEATGSRTPLLMTLQPILGDLYQLAPAQASLLIGKFAEIEKANGRAADDPYQHFQQSSENGDTKAMLEAAGMAPRELRDSLYQQTATRAWEQGNTAEANEIINTKISNAFERRQVLTSLQEQTVMALIEKEQFVQARQMIAQIRPAESRAQQLTYLATAVAAKGDKKTAVELLQEAQSLITRKAKNESELSTQLRIAGAFAELDADRSFAIIGPIIDQINELIAATALTANFGMRIETIKDDEFSVEGSFNNRYLETLSAKDIRALAQADFNKTQEMFDRLQRPEIRIAADLLLARSILQPDSQTDDCTCQQRLKRIRAKANKAAPAAP